MIIHQLVGGLLIISKNVLHLSNFLDRSSEEKMVVIYKHQMTDCRGPSVDLYNMQIPSGFNSFNHGGKAFCTNSKQVGGERIPLPQPSSRNDRIKVLFINFEFVANCLDLGHDPTDPLEIKPKLEHHFS